MFTTVATYIDPIEAQLASGLLQAEGIPARLDDIGTAIANWEWRLAIGGVRLRVPDAQAVHARRVLAALEAGEYALDEEALSGECDDGIGDARREAGALQPPDRESLSSRIAWAALMLLGLPLPWRRRRDDNAVVRRA
ncbi:putative signal transducing protein [Luteimonas terricola]|uniref:DUF2007 domain-containing protein n=1 Tax=Luteimonas terricola TaxID=645597 RepID=A0ABQ2E8D5_9GAMM|nr:DUF2007 domain-containing protein [Luteimonas terricola]GGJ95961.1 hypothetical protein GCM10011394_00900 [Luteimonas terricola]